MKLFYFFGTILLLLSLSGCEDTSGTDETQSQEYDYSTDDGGNSNNEYNKGDDRNGYENQGRDYGNGNNDQNSSANDRQQQASELDTMGLLGDSEGTADDGNDRNYRFKILGELNSTINGKNYEQKTAIDYKGEAFTSGYRYDIVDKSYHIQIVGYSIKSDTWDKANGALMIKFVMPNLETTGQYPLTFPQTQNGVVSISTITPSINNTYIINGSISNATIQTNSGVMNISASFSTALIPLYR